MPTLEFKGKSLVYAHHLSVPSRALEVDARKSTPPPPRGKPSLDDNLVIHGDNLQALKALLPRYANKVHCIYIDPPYNTGKGDWIYDDNVNSPQMQEWLKDKSPVDGEDLERHDKWLCMMWPRLHILKELLADEGAIFISLNDTEIHHLRTVVSEIFGEENFVANIAWWSKYTLSNDASNVSYQHENILFYAKNLKSFQIGLLPRTEEMDASYKNPDSDPRGPWKSTPLHAKSGRDSDRYSIAFSNGATWNCPVGRFPRYSKSKLLELYNDNQLWFGRSGKSQPSKKTYLSDVKSGKTVGSMWPYEEVGSTHEANEELAQILGKGAFDNPKGTKLIKRVIQVANVPKDGIVLDSFAGSGTTGHAVLALNNEDGGHRKFILAQCDEFDRKTHRMINIANKITAERLRRVINGVKSAKDATLKKGLGGSFTYCTLGREISIEAMLRGKNLPDYETLARHIAYVATGRAPDKIRQRRGPDGLFWETPARLYYLLYEPSLKFLQSPDSALNSTRCARIAKMAQSRGKPATVFATHKFIPQKVLTSQSITFAQLPYEALRS